MTDYDIDQLMAESMVKILDSEKKTVAGSGFIIRSDGYLVTCHHVICTLASLNVEYRGREYEADWCEAYSNPEVDIAILKIDVKDAEAAPIINPQDLPESVTVCGFPQSKERNFPGGFDVFAQGIRRSARLSTLSTYPDRFCKISFSNPWNRLPKNESMFRSCRIDTRVDSGISGGPVFANDLGGVVGVIQCTKNDESYLIRWDNILKELDKLGLEPEKNAVCQFLEDIEDKFKCIEFFHIPQKIALKDQYIPIQVTLERKYRHEVETTRGYAESEEELKRAYALKGMDEESERSQVDWEEARKEHQRIMVLADPGMGKSTLLRMEALSNAQEEREKLSKREKNVKEAVDEVVFPLFLRLSDLNETEKEIIDAIPILIRRDYPGTSGAIAHLLEKKLADGKCLLLLDALDEVPKKGTDREDLADKLKRFARNHPCRIISTSRIVGYGGALVDGAKEVEIVPFSPKQTEQYIKTWFTNAADFINDDTVSADGLIRELQNKPQIRGLTQNPLLLSLLCSLYQEKGLTLPARRSQIYEKSVNYILGEWRARHSRQQPEEGWIIAKTELLEELAHHFSCEDKEIFSLRELSNEIEKFLQGECRTDFRDTRTMDLIKELSEEDGIIQKLSLEGDDKYLFLHRTFQEYLTACYLNRVVQKSQSGGIKLIEAHFWEYDWHETLSLLAGMMENPIPLLQAIVDQKDDIFSSMLLLAGRCIAECKADSKLTSTHPLIAEIIENIYKLWHSYPHVSFIVSTVIALGQANPQMFKKLRKNLGDEESVVRWQAAYTIGRIGSPEAVELLIHTLNDGESAVRDGAARALGRIGSPEAVEPLTHALDDEESVVRGGAADALGDIGSPEAVEPLVRALDGGDIFVRGLAARALGRIGSLEAVEPLIHALGDKDSFVRGWAARALGRIGSPEAVEPLTHALDGGDSFVRRGAAEALGGIGGLEAVGLLIHTLSDEDSDVRAGAAYTLGSIGSPEAVKPLIRALDDEESVVREGAARALGSIGSPEAVEPLIRALGDKDSFVRGWAADALGSIGSLEAVELLIRALSDEDSKVREGAADALGRIGSLELLEKLIQDPQIDIYDLYIFPLARKLAVRHSREDVSFIPVYPENVLRK
jgi:HEAT repeat protein